MTQTIIETAVEIAREAGGLLRELARQKLTVNYKSVNDLVTNADKASEKLILHHLDAAFPSHQVLAEESAGGRPPLPEPFPEFLWVIDPLDGTTNYAHGLPIYCVSMGLLHHGQPFLGVVYDPERDELFTGGPKIGATLNGEPIAVSTEKELGRSVLATGFPYDIKTSPENNLGIFGRFCLRCQAVRRLGSAALDLCYLACGRLDGFWELKLHPWDTAAAWAIILGAGGKVTAYDGGSFDPFALETLATNGHIHDSMKAVLINEDE